MPWQLFGYGRYGWSAELARGLTAKTRTGFQSWRGRFVTEPPSSQRMLVFKHTRCAVNSHSYRADLTARFDLKETFSDCPAKRPESKCSGLFDKAPRIGYAAASNISCTLGHGSGVRFLNGAASASVMRLKIAVSVEGL